MDEDFKTLIEINEEDLKLKPFKNKEVALSIHSMMKKSGWWKKELQKYPLNEIRCPTHLSIGQEAVPKLLCLNEQDYAVSTHKSCHYLAKKVISTK